MNMKADLKRFIDNKPVLRSVFS